jgi:predicted ATPase
MLKKLILENWKSFRYAELYFDPLTVLIGTNASGKSNVVEALEFLRRMATGETVDVALNGDRALPPIRGGSQGVVLNFEENFALKIVLQEEGNETDFLYDIKINPQLKSTQIIAESIEVKSKNVSFARKLNADNQPYSKISTFENNNHYCNLVDFETFKPDFDFDFNTFEESEEENRNKFIDTFDKEKYKQNTEYKKGADLGLKILEIVYKEKKKEHREINFLQQILPVINTILKEILILNPIPSQMRNFSRLSETIEQDTSNIAGVLAALPEDRKSEVQTNLSHYLQHFPEGDIKKVWAEKVGRLGIDAMLYCQEEWQPGKITEIDARSMSDGTLRFIGILTALLTRPEGSLIVIEEIDNGLHPSRAELLVRTLREIGTKRKIDLLITTHNPALLDALGPEIVPFVVVAHRDSETGESKLTQLEDIENLPKLLASGTLGKLATKGSIEKSLAESA